MTAPLAVLAAAHSWRVVLLLVWVTMSVTEDPGTEAALSAATVLQGWLQQAAASAALATAGTEVVGHGSLERVSGL